MIKEKKGTTIIKDVENLAMVGPIALSNSSNDPGTTVPGSLYFNTTASNAKVYNGSQWTEIVGQTGAGDAVAFTSPANNANVYSLTPTIQGTTVPGNKDVLLTDGTNSTTVTSDNGGSWTYQIPGGWGWVDDEDYTLTASINEGAIVATRNLNIFALVATTITGMRDGFNYVEFPSIQGTAKPNSTLTIEVGSAGYTSDPIAVDGSGVWGFDSSPMISMVRSNGNGWTQGSSSIAMSIFSDQAPVLDFTMFWKTPEVVLTYPTTQYETISPTATFTGTGTLGGQIRVSDGVSYTDPAEIDPNTGEWSVPLPNGFLNANQNYFMAAELYEPANGSGIGGYQQIMVNTGPFFSELLFSPSSGNTLTGPTILVSGRALPNAFVTVEDAANSGSFQSTQADADGYWNVSVDLNSWSWSNNTGGYSFRLRYDDNSYSTTTGVYDVAYF